jgi:hypothetical protein
VSSKPRYRHEDGRTCIDLHVKGARHLFDGRDPAPFLERDLDDDAAAYIVDAAEELGPKAKLKIVVFLSEPPPEELSTEVIVKALTAHFTSERARLARKLKEHFRRGQVVLLIGLVVLTVFLTLAELTGTYLAQSGFREVLREGLVIIGWVAMWRPLELMLYDWWPLVAQRRLRDNILAAEIAVRVDTPPASSI